MREHRYQSKMTSRLPWVSLRCSQPMVVGFLGGLMKRIRLFRKYVKHRKYRVRRYTLVDDEWFEFLEKWRWILDPKGYVKRTKRINGSSKQFWMHRIINKTPDGMLTDHINGNKLDNRTTNLRTANCQQNTMKRRRAKNNTSGFIGVTKRNRKKQWQATLMHSGIIHYLGFFEDVFEAALVRDTAALFFRGEFAALNGAE